MVIGTKPPVVSPLVLIPPAAPEVVVPSVPLVVVVDDMPTLVVVPPSTSDALWVEQAHREADNSSDARPARRAMP
jgi:hypothetical protein